MYFIMYLIVLVTIDFKIKAEYKIDSLILDSELVLVISSTNWIIMEVMQYFVVVAIMLRNYWINFMTEMVRCKTIYFQTMIIKVD